MNPFAVTVKDNAFDASLCQEAAWSWPDDTWTGWHAHYDTAVQQKRACNRWEDITLPCRRLLAEMLLLNVSGLGLGHLVPDMGLWGGGMHTMARGSVLGLHLDASHHRLSGMQRKLNAILFLSEQWHEEWGGSLEIWDASKTRPTLTIAPVFNRLVLFATNDSSWHGVPQPLTCPDSVRRKTLACWWYARPDGNLQRDRAHFDGRLNSSAISTSSPV